MRTARMVTYCSVYGCKSNGLVPGKRFHEFPKDKKIRAKWVIALRTGKKPTRRTVVCSDHFLASDYRVYSHLPLPGDNNITRKPRLRPLAVPSQNIPKRRFEGDSCKSTDREIRKVNRVNSKVLHEINNNVEGSLDIPCFSEENHCNHREIQEDEGDISSAAVLQEITKLNISTLSKVVQTESYTERLDFSTFIDSDFACTALLGIQKKELFTGLVKMFDSCFEANCALDVRNRIILTFMKLKLGLTYSSLSVLFRISRVLASEYFRKTIVQLAEMLKDAIPWLHKHQVRANLPKSFSEFPNTRVILDCTEIPVEKPKCLLCRIKTYSHYKGTHTVKILIGTAPSGLITFVGNIYGGKASDKKVTEESGILEKCNIGDAIMVDKGFAILDKCLALGLTFIQPSFLRSVQFSREDANRSAQIARARVHVERAIGSLKTFNIFQKKVDWQLLPYFHDIVCVCAAVVNMSAPIISNEKFIRHT